MPVCTPAQPCPKLDPPLNGYFDSPCSGKPLEVCSVLCQTGYELSQDVEVRCQGDGSWSDDLPSCDPVKCPNLLAPKPNGDTDGDCSPGVYDKTCHFMCPFGIFKYFQFCATFIFCKF